MLHENIKTFRKERGLTQEELAIRVNVVRQTVSKWEKGQSVPDADLLQKIAEVLEVSVSQLLGEEKEMERGRNEIAEQLSRINEQLAVKNRRARRIWMIVGIVLGVFLLIQILLVILSMVAFSVGTTFLETNNTYQSTANLEIEATGPYQEITDDSGNILILEEAEERILEP